MLDREMADVSNWDLAGNPILTSHIRKALPQAHGFGGQWGDAPNTCSQCRPGTFGNLSQRRNCQDRWKPESR